MLRRVAVIAVVAVLLAGGVWLWRAWTESDQAKILRAIESGRSALEEKSVRGTMNVLSPDYRDDLGLTIESVKPMLQRLALGVQSLRVTVKSPAPPAIREDGTAEIGLEVDVSGALQGGEPIYLMGTPAEPARVTVILVQDGRRWLVREVQGLKWQEFQ